MLLIQNVSNAISMPWLEQHAHVYHDVVVVQHSITSKQAHLHAASQCMLVPF